MSDNNALTIPGALAEIGSSGLRRTGGFVFEEWHRDLKGSKAVKVYREMGDSHPVIGSVLLLLRLLMKQTDYRVEATGETPEHTKAQFVVESAMTDLDDGFEAVLSDAMTCLQYGWAFCETTYKVRRGEHPWPEFASRYNDGLVGWRKISLRAQDSLDRWDWTESGEAKGLWQIAPPDYRSRYIPIDKGVLFRIFPERNNPEGRSILRSVYTSYYKQRAMEFVEGVGVERNMAGFPKFTVPLEIMHPNASSAQQSIRSSFEQMGQKMRADELACVVMPAEETPDGQKTGYKFELISSSGKNVAETDPIIKRYESRIALGLQAGFLMLGQAGSGGSYSLSTDQTDMFGLAAGGVLDSILDCFNRQAVQSLVRMNGLPGWCAPEVKRSEIEKKDLAALSQYVSTLLQSGAIRASDKLEEHLLEEADLPAPEVIAAPAEAMPASIASAQGV